MKDSRAELRVVVNAYFRNHPLTGSGQYLTHLMATLSKVAPQCETLPYAPDRSGNAVRIGGPAAVSHFARVRFEQLTLPAVARGADVLHYPYWAAPLRRKTPVVITVHDIIPALLAEYRGSPLARCYTWLARAATKRATMIMADSRASQRDIVARLGIPAERVHVVYLAADPAFGPADHREHAPVLEKYSLAGGFVFYVGGLDRRKNVDGLLQGFARALPSIRGVKLAIAGDHLRRGHLFPDLPALARNLGISEDVRFLGVVPDSDLPALYGAATAFAYPSRYEGFGLPPLEAMACGAPVLCSDASSLPEVVGDAAVMLDPRDVEAWAQALVRVVSDNDLRADLGRRGRCRAARFRWEHTALSTLEVYREAAMRARAEGR